MDHASDLRSPSWLPPSGWLLLLSAVGISVVGLLAIYAGELDAASGPVNTLRQVAFLCAGLISFVLVCAVGTPRIGPRAYLIYGVVLALLVLLLVAQHVSLAPLIRPRRNTYRWIELGVAPLQVSEIAKIALVLALARYLRFRRSHRTVGGLAAPLALTLIPTGLILAEPDLGTSLLFPPTMLLMLFSAGARWKHLFAGLFAACLAAPLFYVSPLMSDYQRARVRAVWHQNNPDPRWQMGSVYQLRQSKIALGSGRVTGNGFENAAFFRHNLLPEEHNDFIFAVIGHQWGWLGCLVLLGLYLTIFVLAFIIASATSDPFARLVAVGAAGMLALQTYVNIGMAIGLLPVTGMTLPFASAGGSGLVANYISLGLITSAARRRSVSVAPRAFEFESEESHV